MFKLDRDNYYVDIDLLMDKCKIESQEQEEDKTHLNVFKYEIYKMFLTRLLDEYEDNESTGLGSLTDTPISFNIVLNTLLHEKIIKILE